MENKPRVKTLVDKLGISKGHASNVLSGVDDPSRPLAIRIFRATGWKHPTIAMLTAKQIKTLEEIDQAQKTP